MAQQIEVANAYISLTTKMPGVQKDIERELGAVDSERAGSSMGSKLGDGLKKTALVGAAAAGAAVVGTLGVALTKGFQRLQGIDNATAKMEGLGFSAKETEGLMDNALESVQGTAFGLEDAAAVAAQLAATGIGPGEDMANTLATIANTAAAAGSGMDEMGAIFSKVAASGKAQNDSLEQLSSRGIPIYQELARQLGVTTDEVFDMASAGEIGFAQFADAAQSAGGDVALAMGETFSGSWDNMMASLGRTGAGLLGGVFGELAPAMQGITAAMEPLEKAAAGIGENIGEFLSPFFEMLAGLGEGGLDFSMFGELLGYLSPFGAALQLLEPLLPVLVDSFGQVAETIGGALMEVLPVVLPVLAELFALVAGAVAEILPPFMPLLTTVADIFAMLLGVLEPILEPLMSLIELILPALVWGMEQVAVIIGWAADVIESALGNIVIPIVEAVAGTFEGLITFIQGVFSGDWDKAWSGIVQIFESQFEGMIAIGKGIINFFIDLINGFLDGVNSAGEWAADITGGLVSFEVPMIPHLAQGATVLPRSGGTLAVLAEAGRAESVVDTGLMNEALEKGITGRGGGANIQVDIHPAPGMDEEIVGRAAVQELGYAFRGA